MILSVVINKNMRTTMNFYLVNLSMADLMITAWCPINSLVKELSDSTQYVLPSSIMASSTSFIIKYINKDFINIYYQDYHN